MALGEPPSGAQDSPNDAGTRRPVVVVGIDGSEGSAKALAWAAKEAGLRGAVLRVVHAWDRPRLAGATYLQSRAPLEAGGLSTWDERVHEAYRDEVMSMEGAGPGPAEDAVAAEIAAVLGPSPGVAIEREVKEGRPTRVILDAATDADLVVVGSRGLGGFVGLLLGSVSSQVTHHARCPVTVVH